MFVDFSPPVSGLVSSLCATMLYGVNTTVFFASAYVVFQRYHCGRSIPWFLFGGAVAQFIVSTIHISNSWRTLLEAFVWNRSSGALTSYWATDSSRPAEIIFRSVVMINACLADCVFVWRLYMIWHRNTYVCILPLVMMGTYTTTYFIGVGMLTHPANSDFGVALWWLVAGLALSLITNALIVCLTAGKVWWISWNNRLCPVAVRYKAVVWTILESGAVYGVVMVFLVVFTAMDTQVGSFISNIFVQLCGIIPTLLIVRVGPGLIADHTETDSLPVQFSVSKYESRV